MDKEEIKVLIGKYHSKQCSAEEARLVEQWYDDLMKSQVADIPEDFVENDLATVFSRLERHNGKDKHQRRATRWLAVAASILVILSVAFATYTAFQKDVPQQQLATRMNKVLSSEKGKSILLLENGSRINLDQLATGEIANIGSVSFVKVRTGKIALIGKPGANKRSGTAKQNLLRTPIGGQIEVILSDGTKVFMNAASELKFPTSFSGPNRIVELSGEGYFEVAQNKLKPFKVKTNTQEVEVLGTHFNINSYADEPTTKTTLIEGSVSVSADQSKKATILKPGQQSVISSNHVLAVTNVDAEAAISWRLGLFQFQGADIRFVARQLARWYDVKFEIDGNVPATKLWGEVHRNDTVEKALEILDFFEFQYSVAEINGVKTINIKAK